MKEGEGMRGERRERETAGSTSRSHVKVAGNFRDRGGHVIRPRHKGGEGTKDPRPGSALAISSGLDRFYTEIEKRMYKCNAIRIRAPEPRDPYEPRSAIVDTIDDDDGPPSRWI